MAVFRDIAGLIVILIVCFGAWICLPA